MGRIIYLNPYAPALISGGIKTAYRHVEILTELGYDAWIWQPAGRSNWLDSSARLLQGFSHASIRDDDVLVFPEGLFEPLFHPFIFAESGATRLLFCQNQYNCFNQLVPAKSWAELGFGDVFCSSLPAKRFLESVFRLQDVQVAPCFVDPAMFRPLPKSLRIAMVARKLPEDASVVQNIFRTKYPQARNVRFVLIDNAHEQRVAEAMGNSAILFALSRLESFGLVPVEAMAAGCLVAGYHGHGGLEYATVDNGFWFGADEHEAVADALYRLVQGVARQEPWTQAMRAAAAETAARYNRERTRAALRAYFERLGVFRAAT